MAYPNSQLDANKNPQTRCSNCQTVFEVSHELLASGDTRVRCGECLSIFDAKAELRSQAELDRESERSESHVKKSTDAAVLAGLGNNAAALDVTYSDFDLFSEDADLPEIAYFDQTRETPSIDFDAIEMDDDETFSDTLFVHDVTIDAAAGAASDTKGSTTSRHAGYANIDFVSDAESEDAAPEPLIFNYRDPEPEPEPASALTAPAEAAQQAAGGAIAAPESASIVVNADAEVDLQPQSYPQRRRSRRPMRSTHGGSDCLCCC